MGISRSQPQYEFSSRMLEDITGVAAGIVYPNVLKITGTCYQCQDVISKYRATLQFSSIINQQENYIKELTYYEDDLEKFAANVANIFTDGQSNIHLQIVPRTVVIHEPSLALPLRVEFSSTDVNLRDTIDVIMKNREWTDLVSCAGVVGIRFVVFIQQAPTVNASTTDYVPPVQPTAPQPEPSSVPSTTDIELPDNEIQVNDKLTATISKLADTYDETYFRRIKDELEQQSSRTAESTEQQSSQDISELEKMKRDRAGSEMKKYIEDFAQQMKEQPLTFNDLKEGTPITSTTARPQDVFGEQAIPPAATSDLMESTSDSVEFTSDETPESDK